MSAKWPLPDWRPVQPFPFAEAHRPFTGITRDQGMLSLEYYAEGDGHLVAIAKFGPRSEGAPGQAHGGAILTALDETLGAAAWHSGARVLTARLSTEFRRPVPVGAELLVRTQIQMRRMRMVFVDGELVGPEGILYAAAAGRFIELDEAADQRIFGGKK